MNQSSPDSAVAWQARPPHSDWRLIAPEHLDDYRAKGWEVRPVPVSPSSAGTVELREALELAKNIIFGSQFAATRERNYAKASEYQSYIDTIDASLRTLDAAQRGMDPATIEACAKIAENNGWEATAAQIRDLALPSTDQFMEDYKRDTIAGVRAACSTKCTWPNCDQPSGHDYCYSHCLADRGVDSPVGWGGHLPGKIEP